MGFEMILGVIGGIVAFLIAAVLVVSYICFRLAFYSDRKKQEKHELGDVVLPDG